MKRLAMSRAIKHMNPPATVPHIAVADALAEYVDLFDQDGALIWIKEGKPVRVTPPVLAEIVPKHLAIKHLVTRGDKVAVEYTPLVLDPQSLRPFFSAEKRTGSLLARVTKV
jgi:hypothetical protein